MTTTLGWVTILFVIIDNSLQVVSLITQTSASRNKCLSENKGKHIGGVTYEFVFVSVSIDGYSGAINC